MLANMSFVESDSVSFVWTLYSLLNAGFHIYIYIYVEKQL